MEGHAVCTNGAIIMSEIGGVSNSYPTQVEAPTAPTAPPSGSTVGPDYDISTTQATGSSAVDAPSLRPAKLGHQKVEWAQAMAGMSANLNNVFALMSAMMLKESNDMARVTKELRVQQREAAYEKDLAAAESQRENATYGVIGSSVGAGGQAASAGMNVAGGVKGMQMTSATPSTASATAATAATPTAAGTDAAGAAGTAASTGAGAADAADSLGAAADVGPDITPDLPPPEVDVAPAPTPQQGADAASSAELRAGTPTEGADQAVQRMEKLAALDSTESQRLSARAQNLSLTTQGAGGIASSAGEFGKSGLKYAADIKEAEAAEERAEATRTRAMLDNTKDHIEKLQSYIEGAIRTQDEIQSNKNQTERSIWSHV